MAISNIIQQLDTKQRKLETLTTAVAEVKATLNGLGWRASDLGLWGTTSNLAEAYDKVHEAHQGLVALLEAGKNA